MNRFIDIARAAALAGLCSGCIVWSAAAFAADADALPQGALIVHAGDFSSPGAVTHLKRKLEHVAANICLGQAGDQRLASPSERACYATAMKDGLTQINARQQQVGRDQTVRLANSGNGSTSAQ